MADGARVARARWLGTRRARGRGLLGEVEVQGAVFLPRTRSVHTVGMRTTIDVLACAADGTVLAVRTVRPGHLVWPRRRTRFVVEAPAGAAETWAVAPGVRVGFEPDHPAASGSPGSTWMSPSEAGRSATAAATDDASPSSRATKASSRSATSSGRSCISWWPARGRTTNSE